MSEQFVVLQRLNPAQHHFVAGTLQRVIGQHDLLNSQQGLCGWVGSQKLPLYSYGSTQLGIT